MRRNRVLLAGLLALGLFAWSFARAEEVPVLTGPGVPTATDKALGAQVEAMIAQTRNTPGRESANWLLSQNLAERVKYLTGEKPCTLSELADVRKLCLWQQPNFDSWIHWPAPGTFHIPHRQGKITINGHPDEPAWAKAAKFDGLYLYHTTTKLTSPATTWRVMWDEKYLYFAFDCEDHDIIDPKLPRDGDIFFHDCVEIYLLPEFRTGAYWEIDISPTGSIFDALCEKKWDLWGSVTRPEENVEGLLVGTDVRGKLNKSRPTDEGYTVEVAVPFDQLPGYSRAKPAAGQTLHFMLIRLDENADGMKAYSFQPLLGWGHNIWGHATMVLDK